MADFVYPQINPMAFYQGAEGMQQMRLAPLLYQQAQQQTQAGALNLDQIRLAMQLQRMRMGAAQDYLNSTGAPTVGPAGASVQQPLTAGPGGAQNLGGNSGGISNGPQGSVGTPQTGSPLDPLLDMNRVAQTARFGQFNAILSGGDPNKPVADALKLQEDARRDRMERAKYAAAPALEQVQNIVTSDDPGALLVNNRDYAKIYDQYAQRVGGVPRDYSNPDKIRKAAQMFGNDVRATYGEAPQPMPFQWRQVGVGQGGTEQVNPVTNEHKPGLPREAPSYSLQPGVDANGNPIVQRVQTGGWFGGGGPNAGGATGGPTAPVKTPWKEPTEAEVKSATFAGSYGQAIKTLRSVEAQGVTLSPAQRSALIQAAASDDENALHLWYQQEYLKHGFNDQQQAYLAAAMPVIGALSHTQSGVRLSPSAIRENLESAIPVDMKNQAALKQIEAFRDNWYKGMLLGGGAAVTNPSSPFYPTLGKDLEALRGGPKHPAGIQALLDKYKGKT